FVKADNYPELISTSRHITQGWVDLDTLAYDTVAMTMSGVSSVVGGDPYELRFAVPNNTQDSYIAESAEVDSLPFDLKQDSNFITLDFTSPQSAHIPWKVHFTKGPLSVNASAPIPQGVELYQNYPNPFGPGSPARTDFSTFSFFLPHSQKADLSIYDLLGRRVADIYNGFIAAGTFHIGFDGSHLSPGAYFSVLRTDDNYQVKPLVIER
ncbi:MAG TPA: T9SS type A sorting domain-containing protein, partial [Candidatus Kapabacteria bacterium]|nr:T9SS type A sorting domain-containing protein [Candidatus Kapabacteria bacterium]